MTPEGWRRAALREAADVVGGFAFPHAAQGRRELRYPFFKVSDMNRRGNEVWLSRSENTVDDELIQRLRARVYPRGTVVFPKVGAALLTNKRRLLAGPSLFDNNVMGLIPRDTDEIFLFHLMHTVDFASMVQSGAVPSVNASMVGAIQFVFPPLPEQRKIAAILSSVDDAIEASQAVIDQLQVVKKAMMAELLTKGIPGRHKRFKKTEIGEVPEEWTVVPLATLCDPDGLQTGPFGSQLKAREYTPDGIPVVMPKDLVAGRISTETVARVPEPRAADLAHHRVLPGDVLFARRGDIGRCALVREHEKGWLCGTGCLRARPSKAVYPEFLAAFFGHETPVQWLTEHAVGQTMLNLNTEILGAVPVVLPPLPEQIVIATSVQIIDDRLRAEADGLMVQNGVKSSLMSVLLTGEVRVRVDEADR